MILGGLQKTSLIDYPGRVSCVLFTQGCNFCCPYCHNPSLVVSSDRAKKGAVQEDEILEFLERRKGLLDGVVISGGEPTLHPDLIDFCRRIKKLGYLVKLDTNGSRPEMLRALIREDGVDYVAMDIKTLPQRYGRYIQKGFDPQSLLASIGHIMEAGKPYEFRTTCLSPLVDADVVEGIGRIIQDARLYVLQPFVPGQILCPDFVGQGNKQVYRKSDLDRFAAVAGKWVRKCDVRI